MGREALWKKPERPPCASFFGVKSRSFIVGFFLAGSFFGI